MRVPLSWLKDYVDLIHPPAELAEILTLAGLEVKEIEYIGVPGGEDDKRLVWDRERLILGQLLRVEPHPNADRLVLATVEYGGEAPEVVVTGAPNLFPLVDQGDLSGRRLFSPFALEGAVVFDGHKDGQVPMTLKGRELRGIYNRCMVCSAKELGLGEDHEGVMLFDPAALGQTALQPGTPLQDVFGDVVFEIDIIPNIARCTSIVGVAREVAALTGQTLREPDYDVVMEGPPVASQVNISTENPELNPRFVGMVISGVTLRASPLWMQHRLELAGQRPINVIVDISNYVMLEMGQPNHTFDYDILRHRADGYDPDGPIHIITRLARAGESLTTLDGQERALPAHTILVTDPAGNLSIGGIMGGANSEINEETTNVLLEAAAWNFINIRRSAHALKLNSEAGFRFSRGVHPSRALLGARRAAELMRRHAGGTVWQGIVDYYPNPPLSTEITLDRPYIRRWSGLDLSAATAGDLLRRLDFEVAVDGESLRVTPPDHRLDIEGKHDLVEEICRMYGYDRLPATNIADVLPPQHGNVDLEQEEAIRDILTGLGLQEIITYRLTTPEREARLLAATSPDDRPYITLANPISADRMVLRHSLLASVAETAAANSRHSSRIALFEIGQIYLPAEEGFLPDELARLAIVLTGERTGAHWQDNGEPRAFDFFDLKGMIEGLFDELQIDNLALEPATNPTFRPGRTARLSLGESFLGWLGELHPLVVERLDVRGEAPVLGAELDLALLKSKIRPVVRFEAVAPYPAVHEDIALIVDRTVPAARVAEVIQRAGGFLLKDVELFDVFEGGAIPAGRRSLAYHLTYQAPDKTLRDRDVARLRKKIIQQVESRLGGKLRG